jgi:hypothetical protein
MSFMVREGIVIGHLVSKYEIEVDRAKIEVIEQLPSTCECERDKKFSWPCWFLSSVYKRFLSYC